MSISGHTTCGLCRDHSPNCWCSLWPDEVVGDRTTWCQQPNEHARLVRPGRLLAVRRPLSDEEFERIARRWRKKHGGAHGAHQVKLLGRHPWPWWKRAYYRASNFLARWT